MAKILIVDDEPSVLASIEQALKTAGHKVTLAADGAAGIRSYQQEPADLVISDIFMPDYDGVQLITHFRKLTPKSANHRNVRESQREHARRGSKTWRGGGARKTVCSGCSIECRQQGFEELEANQRVFMFQSQPL